MATNKNAHTTKNQAEKQNRVFDIVSYSQQELMNQKKAQLPRYIKKRKKEFIKELQAYGIAKIEQDDVVRIMDKTIPLLELSEFCFKPFIKGIGLAPQYTAQELDLVFDYFKECIKEMNKYELFPPLKEQYCQLCGFSTEQFATLKNSSSPEIREVLLRVEDFICNFVHIGGLTGKLEKLNSIFIPKTLGRKEAGEQAPVTNNNMLLVSEKEFAELLNKYKTEGKN